MPKANAKQRESASASLPQTIYAEASPRSADGGSLFDAPPVTSDVVTRFYSEPRVMTDAVSRLQGEGFEVLSVGAATVTIAGPPKTFERVFKRRIVATEDETMREQRRVEPVTVLDCPDTPVTGLIDTTDSPLSDVVEGVALSKRYYPFAVSKLPPRKSYWYLDVPGDVSLGMMADRAHRMGYTGTGVKVVMVDSGWYRHPFFTSRGYRSAPVVLAPGATRPAHDEIGHGTGESANVFAVAPDVSFTMVKTDFINVVGAFNAAVALNPHVISCSWGGDIKDPPLHAADQALAAAIASAVQQGIIVIFAAGNGHWGFPGQHPDVISAGGTYLQSGKPPEATEYASGFKSRIYPGRRVPDVCGLVGKLPGAVYIMLPLEPRCVIDRDLGGTAYPNGDGTERNDGWAAFSGTSAAAPQIAGACALMKQAWPQMTPAQAKNILKTTARDVAKGRCARETGRHRAAAGPDLATGHGIGNATKATLLAKANAPAPPSPAALPTVPATAQPSGLGPNGHGMEELVLSLPESEED
jgi:subtilisin family serine protease